MYYGFQSVLEDENRGPVGIVYDATSARGNPALAGFISSPEGFENDVGMPTYLQIQHLFTSFCIY